MKDLSALPGFPYTLVLWESPWCGFAHAFIDTVDGFVGPEAWQVAQQARFPTLTQNA